MDIRSVCVCVCVREWKRGRDHDRNGSAARISLTWYICSGWWLRRTSSKVRSSSCRCWLMHLCINVLCESDETLRDIRQRQLSSMMIHSTSVIYRSAATDFRRRRKGHTELETFSVDKSIRDSDKRREEWMVDGRQSWRWQKEGCLVLKALEWRLDGTFVSREGWHILVLRRRQRSLSQTWEHVTGRRRVYIHTCIFILLKNDTRDKSNEKQVRIKTHKAQRALTAACKNNKSTKTMKTVSEALHKTSKINLKK